MFTNKILNGIMHDAEKYRIKQWNDFCDLNVKISLGSRYCSNSEGKIIIGEEQC